MKGLKKLARSVTLEEIIEGCCNNNRVAQKELYKLYAPKMGYLCLRYLKDKEEVKDALQDGFVIVFEKISSFENKGSFDGWMRKIFVNLSLNKLRQISKEVITCSVEDINAEFSIDNAILRKIEVEELMRKMWMLPDHYRIVLSMYAIDGYSFEDIGDKMNLSVPSVRTIYYRARKCLLQLIKD